MDCSSGSVPCFDTKAQSCVASEMSLYVLDTALTASKQKHKTLSVRGSTTSFFYNETYETKAKRQGISLITLFAAGHRGKPSWWIQAWKGLMCREKEICLRLASFRKGQALEKAFAKRLDPSFWVAILMGWFALWSNITFMSHACRKQWRPWFICRHLQK